MMTEQMTVSPTPGALLSMLALVAGVAGCGGGHPAQPVVPAAPSTHEIVGTVFRGNHFDANLQGAWRVSGEGSMLEITENAVTQFQETRSFCYSDMVTAPGDVFREMTFPRTANAERVSANLYLSAELPATYSLERSAQIPANCRLPVATDALTSIKAMAEIFSLDYAFFKERNIDWAARIAARNGPRAVGLGRQQGHDRRHRAQ
ncbi:hypothetical protein [Massilia sp. TSP1-1-2]|uniref:hypothetical protein n=1 Tax=Massilia sp. TSP1-1-2 TaxID=2804649 RepID=UPI003CECC7C0